MISHKYKIYTVWGILLLTVILPLLGAAGLEFRFEGAKFFLPILGLLLHSIWTFGWRRSALLLITPFLIGLFFEVIGVNYGVIFGGSYYYDSLKLGPMWLGVPVLIPFFWSFFIYTGYCVTSSFLVWMRVEKPTLYNQKLWLLPLLVIIDGLLVVAIDIFMDPIMVASNNWTWINGGQYFGIPIGNFVGWFLITIISTGIFRTYEYYFPSKGRRLPDSLILVPIIGYGSLCLVFTALALNLNLNTIAFIGLSIMLPIALANLFLYAKFSKEAN